MREKSWEDRGGAKKLDAKTVRCVLIQTVFVFFSKTKTDSDGGGGEGGCGRAK